MTAKKKEKKNENALRSPKPKNRLGLMVPKITLPHEEFVKAHDEIPPEISASPSQTSQTSQGSNTSLTSLTSQSYTINQPANQSDARNNRNFDILSSSAEVKEALSDPLPNTLPSQTSQTSQTSITSQTSQSSQTSKKAIIPQQKNASPIAPEKNFQRVPNSLITVAVPSGFFKGKSKQLYDVLYQLTRGAIVPRRSIRIRKSELMKKAGIGSRITFDTNITHLQSVGLIRETIFAGEHAGNEFEVFTIEEIGLNETPASQTSLTSLTSLTSPAQKLDGLVRLETSQTSQSLNIAETEGYGTFKTIFKTRDLTDDDSPLDEALRKLNEAAKKWTGKDLKASDLNYLAELLTIFIDESELAAGRVPVVSNYLALGLENFKRRLYSSKKNKTVNKSFKQPPETSSDKIAPFEFLEDEMNVEPLTEQARRNALVILRGMLRNTPIDDLQSLSVSYTAEDWEWLMNELKREGNTRHEE